ncbi:hypothetical protein AADZ91_08705 [Colwelliaceae bacterium 6441]
MTEHLYNFIRITLFFTVASILQACGGSSVDESEKYAISANTSTIVFANEFLKVSDDSFKVDITFQGNGLLVGYAPDSQAVGWLNYRTENVTDTTATLYVDVVNVDNIISDLYTTKLRLSTGDVDKVNLVHHDIDISLLVWQLITDKTLVSFSGTLGDSEITAQTLSISSESNQWTAETDVDWLSLDVTSGTGDSVITLTPDIANLDESKLYQANIILTESTTGDSKNIPVELGLDRHYLYSNQSTISFSKLANINATAKTLTINTNSPTPINWRASSDVDWLVLSQINDANELMVSVKDDVSFTQTQNNAVITINALNNDNTIDENVMAELINVSFYQSNEKSENITLSDLTLNNNALVNSPLYPHVYIGENNQLKVYHQYTAQLITTLDVSPANTLLEQFIVHPDGNSLLAKADETLVNDDETTTVVTHRYRINLIDNSIIEIVDETIEYEPLRYVSFSGRHFVVTQALEFADDNLQRHYWDRENIYFTSQVDQAAVTEAFYALDLADSSFKRYQASVNDFTSQAILLEQTHQYRPELLGDNQAVSRFIVNDKETGIYAISPTSEWISFNGEVFTDNGLLAQADDSVTLTLTKSHNDHASFARFTQASGFLIDTYDHNQMLVNTVITQGQQPNKILFSQDDKRLVINAPSNKQVEIINIEQISVSAPTLSFETTYGNSTISSQQITLSGMSDSWQAQSSDDWLLITSSTNDGQGVINAEIDESKITGWGLFKASITITDPENNTSTVITVELAVDEIRLFSNSPALGFTSQFDKSTLSHTVDILTNKASSVAWQAQTDAEWLTLTPNLTNNTLTLTVDPTKVPALGSHSAKVTLSSQTLGESLHGEITINFTKGTFDTTDISELVIENISPNNSGIILDALRPYLYVAQSDKIDVYNIIDGSKVNSIQSPLGGVNLTNLIRHPDGSMLLTSNRETYLDDNLQEQTRTNYYRISLNDFSITQLNEETIDLEYSPVKILMVSGKAVVVTQTLELANLALTRQFWDNETAYLASNVTDILNNNNFIAYDATTSNLQHKTLEYNAFTDNSVKISQSIDHISTTYANGLSGIATSNDGGNIYTINSASEWSINDGTSITEQGKLDGNPFSVPVSVTTDSNNNSYFYRFDLINDFFTLSKYDNNQVNVWTTGYTAGSANVYLSPNYQRVIHYNSNDSKLIIDYMPD